LCYELGRSRSSSNTPTLKISPVKPRSDARRRRVLFDIGQTGSLTSDSSARAFQLLQAGGPAAHPLPTHTRLTPVSINFLCGSLDRPLVADVATLGVKFDLHETSPHHPVFMGHTQGTQL
jgi:hypothetical protein